MGILETMIDIPAEHEKNVFGQFDIFAKKIERALHVTLIARNGKVKVLGEEKNVERAQQVLSQLTELSRRGNTIQEQNVDYALSLTMEDSAEDILTIDATKIVYDEIKKYQQYSTINKVKECQSYTSGKANQTKDARTEEICGCDPGKDDHLWPWPCRNR